MTSTARAQVIAMAIIAAAFSVARADDSYIGLNADWFDSTAWNTGAPPVPSDNVFINPSASALTLSAFLGTRPSMPFPSALLAAEPPSSTYRVANSPPAPSIFLLTVRSPAAEP
jgi:hypothetical protein